jgi:hypothetical protein
MGAAGIELPDWINDTTVERAYGRAMLFQRQGKMSMAEAGLRAARARDGRLLKALEGGAEVLHRMSSSQLGHNYQAAGVKMEATEAQLWREAYKSADRGEPMVQFRWIYGAAAELAGLLG